MANRFALGIFDCDGVLVDTKPIECEIVAQVMGDVGVNLTPAEVALQSAGTTDAEMWEKFAAQYDCTISSELKQKYWELVTAAWRERLRPIDGVVGVLDHLKASKIAVCVASSGVPAQMEVTLSATGLAPYFGAAVFSTAQVARGKPAPDVFLLAAASLGVPPHRCAVIEDGKAGILGGLAAGMSVFAYVPVPRSDVTGLDVCRFSRMQELPALLAVDGAGGGRA